MRALVLPAAVLVLLLALLGVERDSRARAERPRIGVPVRLVSRGGAAFAEAARSRGLRGEIAIAEFELNGPLHEPGLRAAILSPRRELRWFDNHDLSDAASAAELVRRARAAARGSLLAISLEGSCASRGEIAAAERESVRAFFEELGAEAAPIEEPSAGWALLALRGERGWIRLAESRSRTGSARLSFLVGTDPARYERFEAALLEDARDP